MRPPFFGLSRPARYTDFHRKKPFLELDYTARAKCRFRRFAPFDGKSTKKGALNENRYIRGRPALRYIIRWQMEIATKFQIKQKRFLLFLAAYTTIRRQMSLFQLDRSRSRSEMPFSEFSARRTAKLK
jgi:hypothetical protein